MHQKLACKKRLTGQSMYYGFLHEMEEHLHTAQPTSCPKFPKKTVKKPKFSQLL